MKRLIVLSLLLLAAAFLMAKPVTTSQALRVAENWMLERTGTNFSDSSVSPLKAGSPILVVSLRPTGFVLVAGDDASTPVIGYHAGHAWGERTIPTQLQYMLQNWEDQLSYGIDHKLTADLPTTILWQRYDRPRDEFVPNREFRDVAPLLSTTWGQEGYYNDLCPAGTPVGCVATAMSQIMKYWSFPTTGNGSHSYSCPPYGTQTANFGSTTYNWAAMPNQVSAVNSSVATLCYHAGVSVDMDYDPTGSGAYSDDVPYALKTYFRYAPTTSYYEKNSYSDTNWATLLRGEFDNHRPVYYSGYSMSSGGHAWVVDGYQGTNHFHINWGWDGYYNGYYYLTSLNPSGYDFTSGQAAVMGIAPTQSGPGLGQDFEGAIFPPTGWSMTGTSTWARSTSTIITGTASALLTGTVVNGKQLVTPKLTVTSTAAPITFKAKRATQDRGEQIKVAYSSSATGPWNYLTTFTITSTATTYTQAVTAITAGDYYFCLEAYSSNTSQTKTYCVDDVTGPTLVSAAPTAAINITAWSAGNVAPGESASSGATFQLSNTGGGILTITSVTNLSASEFKSTINPAVQLVYGQVHEFGFTYDPLNYGTDNQSFQIVTNGGTLTVTLTGQATATLFGDGFENYSDFALTFSPWTQYDGDARPTYGIQDVTFTNSEYTGSYIIFNSSQTTPSLQGTVADAQSGLKGAYCFDAVPSTTVTANNDWLISPQFNLVGPTCRVSFWAKSYTDQYGLERFKVRYSTTNNTSTSFTNYLAGSSTTYVEAPITWTQYTYTLPTTAKYVAIQCVSADAFIFMVDNFAITDSGQTPPTPTFGNVSGYVYEYGTTNPVANAVVTIGTKSAISNYSGFYAINNLVVGTYGGSCSTPGADYFTASVTGIAITQGITTNQSFYLTWSELAVSANTFTANLYLGQSEDQTLTISNPGGTADLSYYTYLMPAAEATSRLNGPDPLNRSVAAREDHRVQSLPVSEQRVAVSGDMYYAGIEDAAYYTDYVTQRATKFTISDFGLWSNSGVTVNALEAYFYDLSTDPWGTEDTFTFKIYGADGSTLLHTSPAITAVAQTTTFNPTTYTLPTPLTIDGDFYVSVVPEGTTSGKPYGLSADYSYGCSYYGSAGSWTTLDSEEHIISANINGNWWVATSGETGTVAPAGSEDITISFDTTDLAVGTYRGLLTIVNNSNYIAPNETSLRGDNLVIPLTLNVMQGSFGNLNGHVYLAGTTTPVADAEVTLPGYTSVFTDASGYYSFTGVETSTNSISCVALGCQDYSGSLILLENQTVVKDIYLDYSQFSAPQTAFTLTCETGNSTTTAATLSNLGTYQVEWTSDSGIWGGDTYLGDYLNVGWEDYDLTGWTGSVGPYSDLYGSPSQPYGHTGDVTWVFNSQGTTTAQYIITPRLHCTASDNLSFWYKQFNESSETLNVMISRTDNLIGSFANFATLGPLTGTDWAQYSASLADYAGEEIYICFQYPRTDGYQYGYIMIDDITGPQENMPYTEWLSCAPASGTLAASGSAPVTLTANAATLPVGTYTAQTWFFGDAVNAPYKLYVTLNVTEVLGVEAPQNLVIAQYEGYAELGWDAVDNADGYHVWCTNAPYPLDDSNYLTEVLYTADTVAEVTWSQLSALGLDPSRAFFRVTADTAAPRALPPAVTAKTRQTPALAGLRQPGAPSRNLLIAP